MTTRRHTLWGDAQSFVIPAAPPIALVSNQLIHIEAPAPATWNIMATVRVISGAVPNSTTNLILEVKIGCGRIMHELFFAFVRTTAAGLTFLTGQVPFLPAQAMTVRALINDEEAGVPPGTVWEVAVWAAPMVPWEGLQVTPRKGTVADRANTLEEESEYYENIRSTWR